MSQPTEAKERTPARTDYPAWAEQLFHILGLDHGSDLDAIFTKMELAANRLAPNTRNLWKWILIAQGAAVLTPGTWLVLVRLNWPTSLVALFVTISTLAVITICWWLRWRGMQHDWARSRVIAEICRSIKASDGGGTQSTVPALEGAPELQAIARRLGDNIPEPAQIDLESARTRYAKDRISDQLGYYTSKLGEARSQRASLNKIVTFSLDACLFLAVAGILISLNSDSQDWLRWAKADYILGFFGMVLPLTAILSQLLGSYQELNRRIGRYAQISAYLEPLQSECAAAHDRTALRDIELRTERCLLGEVVDWFYQTENAQIYYRTSHQKEASPKMEHLDRPSSTADGIRRLISTSFQTGVTFLFKVLVGRVLIMGFSVILTLLWITFQSRPDSSELSSVMRTEDGRLLSSAEQKGTSESWDPRKARGADNGFILISHGLADKVTAEADETGELQWMARMHQTLIERFASNQPEIVLVDWEEAATPYRSPSTTTEQTLARVMQNAPLPGEASQFLQDFVSIQPQGEAIGELVGFKLARAIRQGHLRRDRPMHLIGHSAGGFVVLNAAIVLMELGLDPEEMQITMLDTPLPKEEDLRKVASKHQVEIIKTSGIAVGIPKSLEGSYRYLAVPLPDRTEPFVEGHYYAYRWYIESISDPDLPGFRNSIVLSPLNRSSEPMRSREAPLVPDE